MYESPGMRLLTSLPVKSREFINNMVPLAVLPRLMDMENARLSIPLMAVRLCFWIKWAALPSKSETRIAGKAGTGVPSMSGDRAVSGMMDRPTICIKDITETLRYGAVLGLRPGDHALGLCRPVCYPPLLFLDEIGIKQVYICPDLNYGAAVHADKWIPVLTQYRCRFAVGHYLYLDYRRHL